MSDVLGGIGSTGVSGGGFKAGQPSGDDGLFSEIMSEFIQTEMKNGLNKDSQKTFSAVVNGIANSANAQASGSVSPANGMLSHLMEQIAGVHIQDLVGELPDINENESEVEEVLGSDDPSVFFDKIVNNI